jgi:alpha-N-arabinofuranosidase
MTRGWCLPLLLVFAITSPRAAGPTIAIDATSASGKVSPLFYGLMTEEINHAYDGGLYAELVRNRAFLDEAQSPVHWSVVQGNGAAAAIALDPGEPLNRAIGTSLRLDVTAASGAHAAGVANEGYWGFPVRPHTRYRASLFAKAASGFDGPITLSLQSADGATVYASGEVSGVTQAWKRWPGNVSK